MSAHICKGIKIKNKAVGIADACKAVYIRSKNQDHGSKHLTYMYRHTQGNRSMAVSIPSEHSFI